MKNYLAIISLFTFVFSVSAMETDTMKCEGSEEKKKQKKNFITPIKIDKNILVFETKKKDIFCTIEEPNPCVEQVEDNSAIVRTGYSLHDEKYHKYELWTGPITGSVGIRTVQEKCNRLPLHEYNHGVWVMALALSRNFKIVAGQDENMIRTWKGGKPVDEYNHGEWVTALALSDNGEILSVGHRNGIVKTWKGDNSKPLHEYNHGGEVTGLAVSQEERIIKSSIAKEEALLQIEDSY